VTGTGSLALKRPTRTPRPIPRTTDRFVFSAPQDWGDKELGLQTTTNGTHDTGFHALGIGETTLAALSRLGFQEPTPVQEELIPPALAGRDCLGNAPTGTGKTAAFLIPLIAAIDDRDRRTQALILAPTRELVHQIGREFEKLSFGRRCRAVPVVGGESMVRQQRLLASGCQLVIATPGRLMDLMERQSVRLDRVRHVVLDEADQMLDIGFRPAVETILQAVPETRQTLLLSATMPPGVCELAGRYLNDPVHVRLIAADEDATIPSIRQSYLMVQPDRKIDLLVKLLEREQPSRAIVFCRTKRGADKLGDLLANRGLKAEAMHGNLSQSQRNRVLQSFRTGRLTTLVATDVVGRGIDVPEISHVINFDLPEVPEHYIHRIGRTGRMGRDGVAFSFVVPEQGKLLDQIEKTISRELEAGQVDGIPAPARPVFRPQRPAQRKGPAPARGFRPARRNNIGFHGGGIRRRRSPQGVG
jgi:ATP-dependent RNA helicase DeaD